MASADGAKPESTSAKLARRIKFRLDDGSLIADASLLGSDGDGVVRVPVDTAVDRHLASEKELERIQRLLSLPDLPEVNGFEPPLKKPRTGLESKPSISIGPAAGDWTPKCKDILRRLREHLGPAAAWFEHAVDGNLVKDYYTIIANPIWFSKIEARLDNDEYATPNDFGEDMRLLWKNCLLYNPKGSEVRVIGERGERKFEDFWAHSGLSSERSKRATAGLAAPKFEPELELLKPSSVVKATGPTKSGANNKKPAASGPRANGGRAYSHEVTSGGRAREKALSSERRTQIATDLQLALSDGSLAEEQLSELMGLLPAEAMQEDAEGETELDFEVLDDGSLRKLDAWLRGVKGQAVQPSPSHISHNPSVRLEAGDMEDEEYHSD